MSLIHEALKKLEHMRHGHSPAPNAEKATGATPQAKGAWALKMPPKNALIAFAAVAVAVIGLAFYAFYVRVKAPDSMSNIHKAPRLLEKAPEEPGKAEAMSGKDNGSIDAKALSALNLYKAGLLKESLDEHREALKLRPNDPVLLNNIAAVSLSLGNTKEAEGFLSSSLKIDPDYPEALNNMGYLMIKRGRMEEAVRHLKKAASIDPNRAEAHLNMAIAYELMKRNEDATTHYRRFVELSEEGQLKAEATKKLRSLEREAILK
jgi:tetratricopeptide (TPR) repeat protein